MVTGTRWRRRAAAGVAAASGGLLVSSLSSLSFTPTVQGSPSPPVSPPAPSRKTVHILIADGERDWSTRKATVNEALDEAGVELGPQDEVFPDLDQPVWDGMPIFVCRVRIRMRAQDQRIPYRTSYQPVQTRYRRFPLIARRGQQGLLRKRYEVVYRDGQESERRLVSRSVLREPVDQVITTPLRYQLASRGYYGGRRVFQMLATAYDPGPGSCGPAANGFTAMGLRAGRGVVAVDPAVIPLNARLYVDGYGYCKAGDIGSAIKGNRIDLGFRSRAEALRFGRHAVTVWVLD